MIELMVVGGVDSVRGCFIFPHERETASTYTVWNLLTDFEDPRSITNDAIAEFD